MIRDLLRFFVPAGCVACGGWMPGGSGTGPLTCAPCRSRFSSGSWPRCTRCHLPLGTGRTPGVTCRECASWPPELFRVRWAYVLAPPADALVHGLKYEGWGELAREMGQAVARVANEAEVDVLVPVPTTAQRQRHRGYNQAERLARSVAECLDRPLVDALERGRAGATQVALSPSRRAANVMGAFRGRSGAGKQVRGRSVGLVDDVLTTGATASAAARTLSALGSGPVTLLTFARALPFRTSRAA